MDWEPIIWTVIWIFAGLAAAGILAWIIAVAAGISQVRKMRANFDKGFESDFFKRNR